jgi:hypothetical protein
LSIGEVSAADADRIEDLQGERVADVDGERAGGRPARGGAILAAEEQAVIDAAQVEIESPCMEFGTPVPARMSTTRVRDTAYVAESASGCRISREEMMSDECRRRC